jgi:hypothetical protein
MPKKFEIPKIEIRYTWDPSDEIIEEIGYPNKAEGDCVCSCQCSCFCMCCDLNSERLQSKIDHAMKHFKSMMDAEKNAVKDEALVIEIFYSSDSLEESLEMQPNISCICACSCMCSQPSNIRILWS